jgi:hypothetical protein
MVRTPHAFIQRFEMAGGIGDEIIDSFYCYASVTAVKSRDDRHVQRGNAILW